MAGTSGIDWVEESVVNLEARLAEVAPFYNPSSIIGRILHEDIPFLISVLKRRTAELEKLSNGHH